MRDHRLVIAQRAGDEGGGHILAWVIGGQPAIMHGGVGALDDAPREANEHGPRRGLGELPVTTEMAVEEATSPRSSPLTPSATAKR